MTMRGGEGDVAGLRACGKNLLPMLLALAVAVTVGSTAFLLRTSVSPWLLVAGGVAAATGLFTLFGAGAGLVHFGSMSRQRAFLDGLADAVGDPLVVTDSNGRAVYANGPFIRLASE